MAAGDARQPEKGRLGPAKHEDEQAADSRSAPPREHFDEREERISPERKPMGPPPEEREDVEGGPPAPPPDVPPSSPDPPPDG